MFRLNEAVGGPAPNSNTRWPGVYDDRLRCKGTVSYSVSSTVGVLFLSKRITFTMAKRLEAVDCSLKPTIAMKPEARAKWLPKALRAAEAGLARKSDVFDIIGNPKFINGMNDQVGKRARRIVEDFVHIFTDKQQRHLRKDCALAMTYPLEERAPEAVPQQDQEKMDEMMARCRAFVRENASTWEDRKKMSDAEIQQREDEARIAEEQARLKQEELLREAEICQLEEQLKRDEEQVMMEEAAERAAAIARGEVLEGEEEEEEGYSDDDSDRRVKKAKRKKKKKQKKQKYADSEDGESITPEKDRKKGEKKKKKEKKRTYEGSEGGESIV